MLGRIWKLLFRPKPETPMMVHARDRSSVRLAVDCKVSGDQTEATGLEDAPAEELMVLCDTYWEQLSEPRNESLTDAFTQAATDRYNEYVNAINELSTRGPEILPWALDRVTHPDYDAREQAAFLLGQLGARKQLGDQLDASVERLCELATRSVQEDNKEIQANTAAVIALGEIGHDKGVSALRRILTSSEWDDDEIQEDAAESLGRIVEESFVESDDAVAAARAWLDARPEA